MAEPQADVISRLLNQPCRQVLEDEYRKISEIHRYRKKLEGIENELTWFNGKSNRYWTEDRQGFLQHFQKNYGYKKYPPMGPVFRSVTTFKVGEEPELVYFMVLLVKKDGERRAFMKEHPNPAEIRENETLRATHMRLRNEYRLLEELMRRLEQPVNAIAASIGELFAGDLEKGAENLPLSALNNRFLRSLQSRDKELPGRILALMKEKGATDTEYLDALAQFHAENYEKALELAEALPENHESHDALVLLRETCLAKLGRTEDFVKGFEQVNPKSLDAKQLLYLLQELIVHSPYSELDTDEFDESMRRMVRTKVKQTDKSPYTPMVSRNFVKYLNEAMPLAAKLHNTRMKNGDSAMSADDLERLYQLQMALDLYPGEEDISGFVDLDTIAENGVQDSQEKIGKFALSLLLEKSGDHSFENVYQAFRTLRIMRLDGAFANVVERNLDPLLKFGKSGEKRAYDLILDAHSLKEQQGLDVSSMEAAMKAAGLEV